MGEVKVPGTYTISAFASVFHALYMAGGINGLGTLRNIKVYRNGRLATVVDVYDYILNGRLTGNIRLQDNDVIVVGPYDCLVDVSGSVKRPMTYEMRKNESVASVIRYAGGFAGNAYRKSVRLLRSTGREKSVYNVGEFEMNNFRVADGDVISVDSILNRYDNMIEIKGAVFRPGLYQLGKEINSVRSLIQHAEGVTEDAYTEHAVLHRLKKDRTLEVIAVDVKGILDGSVADIPLKNEDVLFIPTQSDRTTARTITIHGEVQFPGVYQYADNETIEDFIMQAGGLTDAASTAKVDVSRRIIDPAATTAPNEIAKTYNFTLKDGFVIDGTNGFKLQPYDEVYVRRSPGYQPQRNVSISGEVIFAGTYTLNNKNTRLSDLVKMAGGVTQEAYVHGARIERKINEDERIRMKAVMRVVNNQTGRDSVNTNLLDSAETYYVGIELDKALKNPGSNSDLVLREGDKLVVPTYNGTVKISGDVMYPNTVAYEDGRNYRYYINQAGGFGTRAKHSKTFIVYQNGRVSEAGKHKIEPGCEIIVPSKPKSNGNSFSHVLSIGTSIASLATMIATIGNLIK
jgi:polysaccharide biosynthesis protein